MLPRPLNVSGSGINVQNPGFVDANGYVETTFQLSSSTVAGNYSVSVTDSGGTSNSLTFKVIPVISSIQPDDGFVGDSVPVTCSFEFIPSSREDPVRPAEHRGGCWVYPPTASDYAPLFP